MIKQKTYHQTKVGLVSTIYCNQIKTSKHRGHNPPNYTRIDLQEWLFNKPLFHKLYDNWVNSMFNRFLVPSCDRTRDDLGYSLDRLQLMTWQENKDKAHKDMKSGKLKNGNPQKVVVGINKLTGEIVEFVSASQASRLTGVSQGNISTVCINNSRKSAGGYTWKFKN